MKLLAPVKSSQEVAPLLAAGAEEFYCGITPPDWQERYPEAWVNRRSPLSAGVSDLDDFQRILDSASGHPVYVALNAPFYPAGSLEMLLEFGSRLLAKGASALIVSDMDLLLALIDAGLADRIHVSSLATCTNPGSAAFFRDLGVSRVILPRHLTLSEIERTMVPGLELEAFLLNNGCVFEEGLCATTHAAGPFCLNDGEEAMGISSETRERYAFWKWTLNHCGCKTNRGYPLGPCGLCALPRLLGAGIASLKVVGREASLARKEASVCLASRALNLAREGAVSTEIRREVIALRGVPAMCEQSLLCYYPDVWDDKNKGGMPC